MDKARYEPIDKEDNPDLLVQRQSFNENRENFNRSDPRFHLKRFFRSADDAMYEQTKFADENVGIVKQLKARKDSNRDLIKNLR